MCPEQEVWELGSLWEFQMQNTGPDTDYWWVGGATGSPGEYIHTVQIGVFTLVTRGWAASELLMRVSKFNMTPNGECQIISPDRSHIFDAGVNFLTRASPTWKPLLSATQTSMSILHCGCFGKLQFTASSIPSRNSIPWRI